MDLVTLPIRVMKVLGISYLFVSNAAGGINFDFKVGDLMIIKDHINMITNPLIGPNMDEFGPRFPDMTHPYDARLIAKAKEIAEEAGISLREREYLPRTPPTNHPVCVRAFTSQVQALHTRLLPSGISSALSEQMLQE